MILNSKRRRFWTTLFSYRWGRNLRCWLGDSWDGGGSKETFSPAFCSFRNCRGIAIGFVRKNVLKIIILSWWEESLASPIIRFISNPASLLAEFWQILRKCLFWPVFRQKISITLGGTSKWNPATYQSKIRKHKDIARGNRPQKEEKR